MNTTFAPWDYLIVTASNDLQAQAYESQLQARHTLGLLTNVKEAMVVADPDGKRIGSGGSTLYCLTHVLNRETGGMQETPADWNKFKQTLGRLRLLIIHAGGDSRRLPAYSPFGKMFVPVPGESDSVLGMTLFDRLLPIFLAFPSAEEGAGQVVVVAGDVLHSFDPTEVRLAMEGITALGCYADPEQASRHGVFCVGREGQVRLFLQKPSPAEQVEWGAINRYGQSLLDIGVMSFDAATSVALLRTFEAMPPATLTNELDLYREICCALGTEATADYHRRSARASGSTWDDASLVRIHEALHSLPFHIRVLPRCRFLHFGTTRQLMSSGQELLQQDSGGARSSGLLSLNNEQTIAGQLIGSEGWVEGCRLPSPLTLGGQNVVVGVDVDAPLSLPEGACLDVLPGRTRESEKAWFVRCYGVNDTFKENVSGGATFCGCSLREWLREVGAPPEEVWDDNVPAEARNLWNARVFPAQEDASDYRKWLWMFTPTHATLEEKRLWRESDRYSAADIVTLADHEAFRERRRQIRVGEMLSSLRRLFRHESGFSAEELTYALSYASNHAAWIAALLSEARLCAGGDSGGEGLETFTVCRILHSLGSAVLALAGEADTPFSRMLPDLNKHLTVETARWLEDRGLSPQNSISVQEWSRRARAAAFAQMHEVILRSALRPVERPHNVLRPDETVWGRAPARINLGGGWTDTPPYSLENGGDVVNAAVNLNGQPPIHCYGRVIEQPVIRLNSIDSGLHVEIANLDQLLDYRRPGDSFALVKAALALCGFSPEVADWRQGVTLRDILEAFGGGIELTTLAGIPQGSGLGTSSIVGAVIVAVLNRMMGRTLTQRELFHNVLRLEQALTTGGGWQDQVGGAVGGTKITSTDRGLFPDPTIHYVPSDVLDPKMNGGSTLLYYTGLTRLAKDVLEQVVGGYLNRNRSIMAALTQEHQVARCVADALSRKDAEALGYYTDVDWQLHTQLSPDVTNDAIESLRERVRPYVHGARVLGAGSGGFMVMLCKSPQDATHVRRMLEAEPLNERARFFDFDINHAGLEVTAC